MASLSISLDKSNNFDIVGKTMFDKTCLNSSLTINAWIDNALSKSTGKLASELSKFLKIPWIIALKVSWLLKGTSQNWLTTSIVLACKNSNFEAKHGTTNDANIGSIVASLGKLPEMLPKILKAPSFFLAISNVSSGCCCNSVNCW